jgi:GWxTD domain-containing protein
MKSRVIVLFLIVSLATCSIFPTPVAARTDHDRSPGWVLGVVIGAVVVGGVLFGWHQLHPPTSGAVSPRERASELVSHLATPEEKDELARVNTDAEATAFLERFYARRDPTPGTPQNEFRDEQLDRYRVANELFGTNPRGWGGDRRRVYFVYGPPDERLTLEVRGHRPPAERWTSVEVWQYNAPAGANSLPPLLRDSGLFDVIFRQPLPVPGRRLFLFGNEAGGGACRLGFSTEAGEAFDHSIYQPS